MKNPKILFVEDDATLAFLTKDNLEQNQYDVYHCEDSVAALECFHKIDFDICIFDIVVIFSERKIT